MTGIEKVASSHDVRNTTIAGAQGIDRQMKKLLRDDFSFSQKSFVTSPQGTAHDKVRILLLSACGFVSRGVVVRSCCATRLFRDLPRNYSAVDP